MQSLRNLGLLLFTLSFFINFSISSNASDCLCRNNILQSQKHFLFDQEHVSATKTSIFQIFDSIILHLRVFSFHPQIKLFLESVDLISYNINQDKSHSDGFFLKITNTFQLLIRVQSNTKKTIKLKIDKVYSEMGILFVVNVVDFQNHNSIIEEFVLGYEHAELHQIHICKSMSKLITLIMAEIDNTITESTIFLNPNASQEQFGQQNCLIWSNGQAKLEIYKVESFDASYRLIDKDSPSYKGSDEVESVVEQTGELNGSFNYIEDMDAFDNINDLGFNFLITRFLEITSIYSNEDSKIKSNQSIEIPFKSSPKFSINLESILGSNKKNINENKILNCVTNNDLFLNSIDNNSESLALDFVFDFGHTNILSDMLDEKSKSYAADLIKKKDNIYFILMVVENICDLNYDFIINEKEGKSMKIDINILQCLRHKADKFKHNRI